MSHPVLLTTMPTPQRCREIDYFRESHKCRNLCHSVAKVGAFGVAVAVNFASTLGRWPTAELYRLNVKSM
jgi:hypothetical protein